MMMMVSTDNRQLVISGAAVWSVRLVGGGDVIGVEADGMSTGAGTSRWSGSSSLVIGVRFRRSGPLKES